MTSKLVLILGCDCDPDRPRYGGRRYDDRNSPLTWKGIEQGLPLLRERLYKIEDTAETKVRMVFFLRSDAQVREIHGKAAWSVSEYADVWRQLEDEGHELGWHPHLWRWSSQNECWVQETRDSGWITECLRSGYAEITEVLGKNPASCHMGWTFQNNTTMGVLSDLGIGIDFSASPGVYSEGGPGEAGTMYDNMVDWRGTPHTWYRPSAVDFRRPAGPGEEELSIVELPKFASRSRVLRRAKRLASPPTRTAAASRATGVFVQITALPAIYRRVLRERLRTREADPFFATYFHLDELLPGRPRSARGLLYSLSNLERNIIAAVEGARKTGREIEFATGADALSHIRMSEQ